MDEPIRLRCPACQRRMQIPARATYAVCKHCASEYLVTTRGGAYTLQPLTPAEFEITQEVAAAERQQEMGCANTALSLVAVVVVVFCLIGGISRLAFDNTWLCLGAWLIAFVMLVPGAIVLLRNLQADQRRKDRLLRRLQEEQATEE